MSDTASEPGSGSATETQQTHEGHSRIHRPLAVVVLLAAGVFSLPVSAAFLDDEGNENWILPAAAVVMAAIGAVVGSALPGLAGPAATRGRGALVGALTGVVMVVLGTLVFFLLLNGFDGA